jgi:hypothetical protein
MNLNPINGSKVQVHKSGLFAKVFRSLINREKSVSVAEIESEEAAILLQSIKEARKDWMNATINFEYASENEVIDYYAYKIKAFEVKYQYLLRKAKEMGIRTELLEEAGIASSSNRVIC